MGYIRVYSGDELKKQFELGTGRFSIGRTDENDLALGDSGVSREHAAIVFEDGHYYIMDLDSRNGVFLNKQRIKREKLKYWDEIQIHNYVLKFMATSGLGASEDNDAATPDVEVETDKTVFVSLASEKQLDNLRQKSKQSYLVYKAPSGDEQTLVIKKPRIIIGRAKTADIRTGGWFAPAEAARIERQGSTYELVPGKRGNVIFQGEKITSPVKITDGNGFLVRNLEIKFFNRLTKKH